MARLAVVTRIAGHSDAVAEGKSGLLADSPDELVSALDRVLADRAAGALGRRRTTSRRAVHLGGDGARHARGARSRSHPAARPRMTDPKSFFLGADIHEYLVAHGTPPDDVQRELIASTAALGGISMMQISPEQGAFMTMLTQLVNVNFAVEVGTFTGYSALCIARGLAPGGRLLCCDVSEEWTAIARPAWERAGVADRIDLRIAPAIETLKAIPADVVIDLAFVDADKPMYGEYYEAILGRMRTGGLILVDNVLWSGAVIDTTVQDDNTVAIRAFNDMVAADDRVDTVMIPLGDGSDDAPQALTPRTFRCVRSGSTTHTSRRSRWARR